MYKSEKEEYERIHGRESFHSFDEKWGVEFLSSKLSETEDPGYTFEYIHQTVDYFDIHILNIACKEYFKNDVRNLTESQIRKKYHLPNDILPEENLINIKCAEYILNIK